MSRSSHPRGAVLLAAGRGTRLQPLTNAIPKAALPLLDVPLCAFGLDLLDRLEVPLVANVSHLAIEARLALQGAHPALEILEEGEEPLGTAGTLDALRDRLAPTFVTLNSDLLSDLDLERLLQVHEASGARATVAVSAVSPGEGRRADLEGVDGRITHFIDRREEAAEDGLVYLGAAVLEREVLGLIPRGRVSGLAETVLKPLANAGEMAYLLHEGYAVDVGTPERFLQASLDLLAGLGPRSPSPPGKVVEVQDGRAYLGPDARAEPGCLRDGAVVLAGALVEGRVQRSVVMPGEVVGAGSVLDRVIWFSARAIPAAAT